MQRLFLAPKQQTEKIASMRSLEAAAQPESTEDLHVTEAEFEEQKIGMIASLKGQPKTLGGEFDQHWDDAVAGGKLDFGWRRRAIAFLEGKGKWEG